MFSLSRSAGARVALAALLALGASAPALAQCPTTDFVTGLKGPTKLLYTNQGNLLVAETGVGTNAGRVSIVEPDGTRRTLLDGLPSSVTPEGEGSGPSGMVRKGNVLYLVIGEGDVTKPGGAPGSTVPNPLPSSKLFSSILAVKFSANVERTTQGFTLTPENQQRLFDGRKVKLRSGGKKLTVSLLVNFPDYVANARPDEPDNVRASNPFGAEIYNDDLFVNDASMNEVRKVNRLTGQESVFTTFPQIANPLPFGPPMVDAVPDSIRFDGENFYVTLLTGFPFAPSVGEVQTIDPDTGAASLLIGRLTTPIDVLPVTLSDGARALLVLEISSNLREGAPGSLLLFRDPAGEPTVLADCLIGPTHLARDGSGDIVVTSLFTNKLQKIALP